MYCILLCLLKKRDSRFIVRSQKTGSGNGGGSNSSSSSSKSGDIVNKQDENPSQRNEVNVENYGQASSIGQILKDLEFQQIKIK